MPNPYIDRIRDDFRPNPYIDRIRDDFRSIKDGKLKDFTGRQWVIEKINDFFGNNTSGYLKLIAEPGMGKSAIASYYHQNYPSFIYFNNIFGGTGTSSSFLSDICNHSIGAFALGSINNFGDSQNLYNNSSTLENILATISRDKLLPNNQKIVITVDALDEAQRESDRDNILFLPRSLPPNIFFLVTQRPNDLTNPITLVVDDILELSLNDPEYEEFNSQDIREYIDNCFNNQYRQNLIGWINRQNLAEEDLKQVLIERTARNFMYISILIKEIYNGNYKDALLEQIPQGITGYYNDIWGRMNVEESPLKQEILSLLVESNLASGSYISANDIADMLQQEVTEVNAVLQEWNPVLYKDEVEGRYLYLIYHKSFSDFLKEKLYL